MTVILDPMVAATVAVSVCFKSGSRDEKPCEHGITHFCEHMLCKGTTRFAADVDINDYIYDNAGTRGARTGQDKMELYGTILAENVECLLDVFADQLQNSVFDDAKIERERTIIADELRRALDDENRAKAEFIVQNISLGAYSVYHTLGTHENIASFTKKQMKMFMARRFSGKNCLVCVSGRIDNPEKLLGIIERKFAFLPAFDVSEYEPAVTYAPAVAHMAQPGKKNVDVTVLMPHLYPRKPENIFRRMCVNCFNNYLNHELFRVLRSENGLVYGVGIENFDMNETGVNGFSAQTAPENAARMVTLMAQTAQAVCTTNPITDAFVTRYNKRCQLGDALWLESPARRRDRLVGTWLDYDMVYDFHDVVRMGRSITANDVITHTSGYFHNPVSILSAGAEFDANVLQIWHDNFSKSAPMQSIMISKDNKCH